MNQIIFFHKKNYNANFTVYRCVSPSHARTQTHTQTYLKIVFWLKPSFHTTKKYNKNVLSKRGIARRSRVSNYVRLYGERKCSKCVSRSAKCKLGTVFFFDSKYIIEVLFSYTIFFLFNLYIFDIIFFFVMLVQILCNVLCVW